MALPLSTIDLARLEAASRALLSPLVFDDADGWRDAVMAAACEAFGARTALFDLPGQHVYARAFRMDGRVEEGVDYYLRSVWTGTGASPDPIINRFHRQLIEDRLEVWDVAMSQRMVGFEATRATEGWAGDVILPNRMLDGQSLFVHTTAGSVHLSVHDLMRTPGPGELLPVLGLLLPSFKAGIDTLGRLEAHRTALDAVGTALAAFGPDGYELHRTPSLLRLLAADPEARDVEAVLGRFAQQVRPLAFARRAEGPGLIASTTEVQTRVARYTLRAVLLPPSGGGFGEAFLVTLEADGGAPALPTADEARRRFGLSRREAEVALLVAQGLSNEGIAARLFVSAHTVRHHVEAVMAKLALTGRGREAVAPRLLGTTAEG